MTVEEFFQLGFSLSIWGIFVVASRKKKFAKQKLKQNKKYLKRGEIAQRGWREKWLVICWREHWRAVQAWNIPEGVFGLKTLRGDETKGSFNCSVFFYLHFLFTGCWSKRNNNTTSDRYPNCAQSLDETSRSGKRKNGNSSFLPFCLNRFGVVFGVWGASKSMLSCREIQIGFHSQFCGVSRGCRS